MTEVAPAEADPAVGLGLQVSIDCAHPAEHARFRCVALNYMEQPPPAGYASCDAFADEVGIPVAERDKIGAAVDPAGRGPRLLFHGVPEGKVVKNRLHLDINAGGRLRGDERQAAVREHAQRLVAAVPRWSANATTTSAGGSC